MQLQNYMNPLTLTTVHCFIKNIFLKGKQNLNIQIPIRTYYSLHFEENSFFKINM